jgi:ABC-type polysaccharide/polyol phosphate export permease
MGSWLKTKHDKHVVTAMPKPLKGTMKQLKMFTGFTVWTMISSKIQEASKLLKAEDTFESRINFVFYVWFSVHHKLIYIKNLFGNDCCQTGKRDLPI